MDDKNYLKCNEQRHADVVAGLACEVPNEYQDMTIRQIRQLRGSCLWRCGATVEEIAVALISLVQRVAEADVSKAENAVEHARAAREKLQRDIATGAEVIAAVAAGADLAAVESIIARAAPASTPATAA